MTLVAGIDSSTQSCKVVVRDARTGALVRSGRAAHPAGTEVDPAAWWDALTVAAAAAGGLDDVAAISVGAQQHGMVCLDADGQVVRPALLWNDTRSAEAAVELIAELGGPRAWADAVGSVPVASFTVTKLRWLAEHEPDHARRTAAVCLPHDWLTWRLAGHGAGGPSAAGPGAAGLGAGGLGAAGPGAAGIGALTTDRSDASGTGYWSPATGEYRPDLLELAMGSRPVVPSVLGPRASAGQSTTGARLGPGTGDNAAAALGVGARAGDVIVSIGTSGTVFSVAATPAADATGTVAGFADATGLFLPLIATLNAARILDAAITLLGVDHHELDRLALSAPAGADGLVLVPYFEGERTPNRPHATAALHGMRLANTTPAHLARAAVEGMLCALADGLDALVATGTVVERVILIGGGAQSQAVRRIAPGIFGVPILVPPAGEYVADGAARQAAWVLLDGDEPPQWTLDGTEVYEADPAPQVRATYATARDLVLDRP